ncbi:MAG: helix-turn-helix domain-containing protein [Candidatus Promineifilaceae bacterium]
MADETADTVLTVPEVSEYLKLGESTVYRLAKEGKLPARKVGGVWRFSLKCLNDWLYKIPAGRNSAQPDTQCNRYNLDLRYGAVPAATVGQGLLASWPSGRDIDWDNTPGSIQGWA